jgi:hypothetical protein
MCGTNLIQRTFYREALLLSFLPLVPLAQPHAPSNLQGEKFRVDRHTRCRDLDLSISACQEPVPFSGSSGRLSYKFPRPDSHYVEVCPARRGGGGGCLDEGECDEGSGVAQHALQLLQHLHVDRTSLRGLAVLSLLFV